MASYCFVEDVRPPPLSGGGQWRVPGSCTSLNLSFSRVDPQALAAALRGARLGALNLTWTSLGPSGAAAVASSLASMYGLTSLDVSGNWIGDEGAAALAGQIGTARACGLAAVRMRWNGLTARGARALAGLVRACPGLASFDLSGNWIADAMPILQIQHRGLKVLGLGHNALTSSGIAGIGPALAGASLTTLDISGNEVDDDGARQIASALLSGCRLQRVDLGRNQLTDTSGRVLAAAMERSTQVRELRLAGNVPWRKARAAARTRAQLSEATIRRVARVQAAREAEQTTPPASSEGVTVSGGGVPVDTAPIRWALLNGSAASDRSCVEQLHAWIKRVWATEGPATGAHVLHHWASLRGLSTTARTPVCTASIGRLLDAAQKAAASEASYRTFRKEVEYWRHVYPMAAPLTTAALSGSRLNFFYQYAPPTILERPCSQHAWSRCRLDRYLDEGDLDRLPKILYGELFSPFRLTPGACMRSQFHWSTDRSEWEARYPHESGIADHAWAEVAHTKEQTGSAWLYLTPGSGVFWNCGRSLRVHNKAAAAIRLLRELRGLSRQAAIDGLARMIESNGDACLQDHCTTFMRILRSNRTDRNDNCYGICTLAQAPLARWLSLAETSGVREWRYDHMSASSVFDSFIYKWGRALKYDSVQLTMQPQVWCGIGWTTELVDLRARAHKATDVLKQLTVRDPLQPGWGEPCIVRSDDLSRKAFQLCIYCEGTAMERVSRCIADASGGKPGFTVYSTYPRQRFQDCLVGAGGYW